MTARVRTRLGEEAKFELALAAASRERSNRPMALVVLAIVFFVAAAIFAGSSIASRASSRARLSRELQNQAWAELKVEEWKKVAQTASTSGAVGKPGEFKVSRMEDLATRAGMKTRPNAPVSRDDKSRAGTVVWTHVYTEVRDPSLATMIDWLRLACTEIGGLEVESLTVRPEPTGWKMDVTFRRWERAG